ncbi:MAG: 3-hydroxyacyl-CoA dehydrogenase NAD-binding domain-containing protein [Dehalococcoidales bacterium]|nr:3-hydroxyacyl-CoA dehydrogenase NAD-binding domain-containing protein [Dehalococcoidales bacterium]
MKEPGIEHVAIIGAGLMGFGIGVEYARFGYQVSMYNTGKETSRKALEQSRKALDLMAETELITSEEAAAAYRRLHPTTDLEDAVKNADFICEAAPEILSLKQEIFAKLDNLCPPSTILATNTSGFLVTDIASATKHPERVIATHYFQPPHFVPLVEVVAGQKTDPAVVQKTARLLRGMHKKVVILNKEI